MAGGAHGEHQELVCLESAEGNAPFIVFHDADLDAAAEGRDFRTVTPS